MPLFRRGPTDAALQRADADLDAFLAAWTTRFGEFHPLDPVENAWFIGPYRDWCARQSVQVIGADDYIDLALRAMAHPYRDTFTVAWTARFGPIDSPKAALAVFPYFMSYDMENVRRHNTYALPQLTPDEWIAMTYGAKPT